MRIIQLWSDVYVHNNNTKIIILGFQCLIENQVFFRTQGQNYIYYAKNINRAELIFLVICPVTCCTLSRSF